MTSNGDRALDKVEETQVALRESIETVKRLVDESDYLIKKHRSG